MVVGLQVLFSLLGLSSTKYIHSQLTQLISSTDLSDQKRQLVDFQWGGRTFVGEILRNISRDRQSC